MSFPDFDTYVMGRCLSPFSKVLMSSFEYLQPDPVDYRNTGFSSRCRHFAAYQVDENGAQRNDGLTAHFNSKRSFHVLRKDQQVAPIDGSLGRSEVLERLLRFLVRTVPLRDPNKYAFGVNQIRVRATDVSMGSPAPGLHQDGYAFSCHLNVARQNVSGGASILATNTDPQCVVVDHTLQPGEFVFFNDRTMFHTATPVTPRITGYKAWRDMLIVDVVELSENDIPS